MAQSVVLLLVEDNPDDEALAKRALKKAHSDSEIVVARDGQEALDFLFGLGKFQQRDHAIQPQVVFLDINLPKVNGLEVLKALREDERTASLPVVILSSSDENSDISKAYALGANSYINKPVNFNEFCRQIDIMGQYWLDINRVVNLQLQ